MDDLKGIVTINLRICRGLLHGHYTWFCDYLRRKYNGTWYSDTFAFYFPIGYELVKPEILAIFDYLEIDYIIVDSPDWFSVEEP